MRTLVLVAASTLAGGWLFNRFLAPTLNIPRSDGFGMDDVAQAATIAATFYAANRFLPRRKG